MMRTSIFGMVIVFGYAYGVYVGVDDEFLIIWMVGQSILAGFLDGFEVGLKRGFR